MLNLQFHILTLLCLLVLMSFNIVVVASSFKQQFDYSRELVSHTLNKELVSHKLKEFTQFSATSSISKTPDPVLYQCVKGQEKLISQVFNVSVSIAKSKNIGSVMTTIDLSDYVPQRINSNSAIDYVTQRINSNSAIPFVTIVSSSDDYFCAFNQKNSVLQCKSQVYCKIAHLSVVYQLNLSCVNYHLHASSNVDDDEIGYTKIMKNLTTNIEVYIAKKSVLKSYNDTLLILSPQIKCASCSIRDQVNVTEKNQLLYLQSQLNAYSYDGSCCVIRNSSGTMVGKITKSFPQHWSVRKSEIFQDIGEMKYTFPRPGLYQITCCSNENQGTQPQFNAALGIMPGGLNFYYNGSIGTHSKTWTCPSLPPVSVTSIDTQSLWNVTCNDMVKLVRDTNCVDQLTRAIQLNVCKLSCSKSSLPTVDILSMICHSLTPIIECNLIDVYKLPFYYIQKTFINNGTAKTHRRVTATFSDTQVLGPQNIAHIMGRPQLKNTEMRLIPVIGYGEGWFLSNSLASQVNPKYSKNHKLDLNKIASFDCSIATSISLSKYHTVAPLSPHSNLNVVYILDGRDYIFDITKAYCGVGDKTFFNISIKSNVGLISSIYLSSSISSDIYLIAIDTDGYVSSSPPYKLPTTTTKKSWYIESRYTKSSILQLVMQVEAKTNLELLNKSEVGDSTYTVGPEIEVNPLSCSSHRANWNEFIEEQWSMQHVEETNLKDTAAAALPTTIAIQSNLDIVQVNANTNMASSECNRMYTSNMIITGFSDNYDSIQINTGPIDSSFYYYSCILIDKDTNNLIASFSRNILTTKYDYCGGMIKDEGNYCTPFNLVNTVELFCCTNELAPKHDMYPYIGIAASQGNSKPVLYNVVLPDFESCTSEKCGVMTSLLVDQPITNGKIEIQDNKVKQDAAWCGIYASYGSVSTIFARFIVTTDAIGSLYCVSNYGSQYYDICTDVTIEEGWTLTLKCCTNSDGLEFVGNVDLVVNIKSSESSIVLSSPGVCNVKKQDIIQ